MCEDCDWRSAITLADVAKNMTTSPNLITAIRVIRASITMHECTTPEQWRRLESLRDAVLVHHDPEYIVTSGTILAHDAGVPT